MSETTQSKTSAKSPSKMRLAGEVAQHVEILGVDLAELVCQNRGGTAPGGTFEVSIETETSSFYDTDEHTLVVTAKCRMDATAEKTESDESDEDEPVVQIGAVYVLGYAISEDSEFQQEQYDAFAEINGLFNLWPFWRELVHNLTMRMGLPPLTLPVRRGVTLKKS